jgi:protein tyrosine phosphatase (PTP) superfamily phosphohydrolase (DUF442 family)
LKIFSSLRKFGLMLAAVITTTGITPLCVSAQDLPSAAPALTIASVRMSDSEIDNFARVSTGITRGAQPSDKALTQMAKDGVKTIIDLRMNGTGTESEEALTRQLGMKYIHIPMTLLTPSAQQVSQFLDVVNTPSNLPVFVHCRQGADRTGTLVAIYRRVVEGWDFDKAYVEMRDHHFKPFLLGMKDLVKNCDKQSFGHASSAPIVSLQSPSTATTIANQTNQTGVVATHLQPAGTVTMTVGQ